MKKVCILFCVVTAVFSTSVFAQSRVWEQIDSLFQEWDKPGSPGCALGIYHHDQIVYANGYGYANLDYDIPITPETVFYIGSVSKQFAAAAIAILIDKGKLALDDDVRNFIPELKEYDRPIRVKHLIHHTSGLRDLYSLMAVAGVDVANVMTIHDKVDLIVRQSDLNFLSGDEFLYSNSGYTLIALLVERVSGQTLREFTDEHIFRPLHMHATHFHDNRFEIVRNRAVSYRRAAEGRFEVSYLLNFEGVGPGGLYTTVQDLFLWDRNFYRNQLEHAPNFLDLMHTRGILTNGDTLDYAFGLRFGHYKGLETIGHSGAFMGFRADYLRIPEYNFALSTLCNLGDIDPAQLNRQIADIYLREVITDKLREYIGTYRNKDFGVSYEIIVQGSELYLDRAVSPRGIMTYISPDEYRVDGWTIRFRRNQRGVVEGFMVTSPRARNIWFEKQRED